MSSLNLTRLSNTSDTSPLGSLLPPHLGYNLLHLRWERDTETILLQRLAALELRLRLLDTENLLAALVTITYSMPIFHKGL